METGHLPGWDQMHVRSPSVFSIMGFTLLAYEGWDESGPTGIGFALGRERWLIPSESELYFYSKQGYDAPSQEIEVHNRGLGPLSISEIQLPESGFQVSVPDTPLTLESDEKTVIEVLFEPDNFGSYEDEMVILSNDPLESRILLELQGYYSNISSADELNLNLNMPADFYNPSDYFYLDITVENSTPIPITDQRLFVILEIDGNYWFAPEWQAEPGIASWYEIAIEPGIQTINVIPQSSWPETTTSLDAVFYAGITDPKAERLLSNVAKWEFGW